VERVEAAGGPIRVKTARLEGRIVNAQPEYEDCLALARRKGRPLKEILRRAEAAAAASLGKRI